MLKRVEPVADGTSLPRWLTEDLQQRMKECVAPQLTLYANAHTSQRCAFNGDHAASVKVAYRNKYYAELVTEFLQHRRSSHYLDEDSDVPQSIQSFLDLWECWHKFNAKFRLLCLSCYRQMHPTFVSVKEKTNDVSKITTPPLTLQPYSGDRSLSAHKWLDLKSWGSANEKGNYSRLIDGKHFTLFRRNDMWYYAYDAKFSRKGLDRVQDALQASYETYRELIHRCCV